MPKPTVTYTLTLTRHLDGSWSFTYTRGGRVISECLERYSDLAITRQCAFAFLCYAVDHYNDRARFTCSEHEVREGKRKLRNFAAINDLSNSNLATILKPARTRPQAPNITPYTLADL